MACDDNSSYRKYVEPHNVIYLVILAILQLSHGSYVNLQTGCDHSFCSFLNIL